MFEIIRRPIKTLLNKKSELQHEVSTLQEEKKVIQNDIHNLRNKQRTVCLELKGLRARLRHLSREHEEEIRKRDVIIFNQKIEIFRLNEVIATVSNDVIDRLNQPAEGGR